MGLGFRDLGSQGLGLGFLGFGFWVRVLKCWTFESAGSCSGLGREFE